MQIMTFYFSSVKFIITFFPFWILCALSAFVRIHFLLQIIFFSPKKSEKAKRGETKAKTNMIRLVKHTMHSFSKSAANFRIKKEIGVDRKWRHKPTKNDAWGFKVRKNIESTQRSTKNKGLHCLKPRASLHQFQKLKNPFLTDFSSDCVRYSDYKARWLFSGIF